VHYKLGLVALEYDTTNIMFYEFWRHANGTLFEFWTKGREVWWHPGQSLRRFAPGFVALGFISPEALAANEALSAAFIPTPEKDTDF
jgi:hypothetical protein